jgi:hypothetical protein
VFFPLLQYNYGSDNQKEFILDFFLPFTSHDKNYHQQQQQQQEDKTEHTYFHCVPPTTKKCCQTKRPDVSAKKKNIVKRQSKE